MKINHFEDLIAWQKGQDLAVEIYTEFRKIKDFGFRNQILRASISISNNIAEGFTRKSDKEFIRFLSISLSSCSEVKSMIYLAKRLGYISIDKQKDLLISCSEVSKITKGLIRSLNS